MTPELMLSIASLGLSTATSILTIIINAKIGKLNNLEAEHKYKKHITKFELSFKDEEWLFNLMKSDDFHNYDRKSRKLIYKWWREYSKAYPPDKLTVMLPASRDFSGAVCPRPLPIEVPVEDINKEDSNSKE